MRLSHYPCIFLICTLCRLVVGTARGQESGAVWLDELELGQAAAPAGEPRRNRAFGGGPLSLAGVVYERGVGMRAPCSLRLLLDGGSTRFTALVGVNDSTTSGAAAAVFEIHGDSRLLWRGKPMRPGDPPKSVKRNISGLRVLLLSVQRAGAGPAPNADWADAKFTVTGKPPRAIPPIATEPYVLTPPPPSTPRINGPTVYGARPGSPILFSIPVTGARPLRFSAAGLPAGLKLNPDTGRITGRLATPGQYRVRLRARNWLGEAERELRIVAGERLCLTPPLGWNSWNCWGRAVDDGKIRAAARAMNESGLSQHGWSYVNLDDGWQAPRGGKHHALQGNEKFPDMPALAEYVHGLGLKIGLYGTPWVTSYAGFPGGSSDDENGAWSLEGNEPQFDAGYRHGKHSFAANDARQWAEWGFDYLKYDWNPIDVKHAEEMASALRASGRDIVLSLSNTAPFNGAADWARLANCWRTTKDIEDAWASVAAIGFAQERWAEFAAPGHWNDPDMLVLGRLGWGQELRPTRLTPDEQYAHFSLWCLLSAPLLLGCDLTALDDFTLGLLTNDEVLAVNQDPLGRQARRAVAAGDAEVWAKPLADGSLAIGLFNRGPLKISVEVKWTELGITGPHRVRDLWRQKDQGTFTDRLTFPVPRHGVVLLKLAP